MDVFTIICTNSGNHKCCIKPCVKGACKVVLSIGDNLLNFSSWEESLVVHTPYKSNESPWSVILLLGWETAPVLV